MQESVLHLTGWWGGAIEQRHLSTEILRVNFSFHQPSELSLGGELGIRKEEVSLDRRACGSCDDSLTPPAANQGYGSSRFLPPLLQFNKQSAIVGPYRVFIVAHCCIIEQCVVSHWGGSPYQDFLFGINLFDFCRPPFGHSFLIVIRHRHFNQHRCRQNQTYHHLFLQWTMIVMFIQKF